MPEISRFFGTAGRVRTVSSVTCMSGYRLLVTFSEGSVELVDLESPLDRNVFEPLKEPGHVRSVQVNPDRATTIWASGAHMAPELLAEIRVAVR